MNFDAILRGLDRLAFRHAVWLVPLVFALHVVEEAPRFAAWVRRYASARFTNRDFVRNNALGMAVAVALCVAVAAYPHEYLVAALFAFAVWQLLLNTLFHVATTAAYGEYSPGLITALTLYPAVFWYLSRMAFRDGLLAGPSAAAAFALGVATHAYAVAVQVYFVDVLGLGRRLCNRLTRRASKLGRHEAR